MRTRSTFLIGCTAVASAAISCTKAPAPAPTPAPTSVAPARPNQQTVPTPAVPDSGAPAAPGGRGGRGGAGGAPGAGQAGAPNPQPYARVITPQAQTKNGLFKVHQMGERVFFEIPRRELDKDILLVQEIAKTTFGSGYGGQAVEDRVLRFERRENRVLLRNVSYEVVSSDSTAPIAGAVAAANVHPIIAIFNVESYGPDSAAVIDVSRLFTQPPGEFSPTQRGALAGYQIDVQRSWVERVASFPDNVNVYSTLTYQNNAAGRGGAAPGGGGGRGGQPAPSATLVVSYSFHKLPEVPMTPRLCDNRVGYFNVTVTDYSQPAQRVADAQRCFITRYRLEKKDPSAAVSEPVKQIVYYLDPATPVKWRPWLIKGIEDWQPAFEAAGFKNAIVGKVAPDDPDWSPEDARYSVVRWLPSTTENASGPNIHDPRSGEILNAHIQFYHNVQNLARTWYFTQAAANDPRARTFPFPDSLMGRLLEYVLAHEVGHTLGFQHNMKSSSQYPVDSLRNADFLRRMGHVATLMDYSRFNYVAQPEDKIPPELLIPRIGPYDIWATKWGYAPINSGAGVTLQANGNRGGAKHTGAEQIAAAEAERSVLDQWAREQDEKPWLRFSTSGAQGSDPGDETEAVGDFDPVRATELGFKNLKRNMQWIESATVKPTEDFELLSELYTRQVGQWRTELGHVANLVGGFNSQEKYGSQTGPRFVPVPKAKQVQAMKFIAENGLQTPTWLVDESILRKIEPIGEVSRIVTAQSSLITSLLSDAKLTRLIDAEALAKNPSEVYTLTEMLSDVRRAVFTEVYSGSPVKIDVYRRGVQRSYLTTVGNKLKPPAAPAGAAAPGAPGGGRGGAGGPAANTGEIKAMLRGELKALDSELAAALGRAADVPTRRHLEDARVEIARILKVE